MDLIYILICFLVWFILGDDINVYSITRENIIQSNKTLASQGSQLSLNRNKSTPYVSVDTQNSIESYNRPFCESKQHPIVKVCTDDEVLNKRAMYIDTMSVPNFQQTLCECFVTPVEQHNTFTLILKLENLTGRQNMQFKINNITVGKFYDSESTNIIGDTKLLFSTFKDHQRKGVCLAVYSEHGIHFNLSCKRSTAPKDKDIGVNAIIISSVSATCGLLCGIVISVVCVIFYKRKKKGKRRNATTISSTNAHVESDYYMTENAMYNMGQISTRETVNENEHNTFEHDAEAYAGTSPSHYDCIRESTDRNQSSENAPSHAVTNEYSTCLKAGQVTAGGLNKNTSNNYQKYQPKGSRINGEDDTVYDSTKSSLPQQAVGNNDYHHLGSVGLNGLNRTYDKIGNTGVVKN
ncbi:uncharacterized protein LOC132743632 [Ruditapes philippinarum]|uniref:uncharacterized protein LOC132743632 n=1 Tax=Ruditapes philippinarum TaxID=129788 RepID=UPI00295B5B2B|nr:uncharacterized protein LOC132743632 [Ruditapes philippinarum]